MTQSSFFASWRHFVLRFYIVTIWLSTSCGKSCAAQDGIKLDISSTNYEIEREAFYDVLEALNHDWDWRTLLPDPCGVNAIKGINCDLEGSTFYFTDLNFGPTYDNTPACSFNATIHPSIVKFTRLRTLSFYNCFTVENRTIPPELGTLGSTLLSLTFRSNSALIGSIPEELGSLNGLERLILTQNTINGSIPVGLGELRNLKQIVLSHNNIDGAIPFQIGSLQKVIVLDLSHNFISGAIPVQLGSLNSLQMLDLSHNNFDGAIPDEFGNLESLTLLDLSNNELSGSLPRSMAKLYHLQQLYLNNNPLGGRLPDFWSAMSNLLSVDLSHSDYEGAIPESIGKATKLKYLGLSGNKLTGSIPYELGNLPLYEMNLSQNSLSGPIPFSAAFLLRLGPNLRLFNNSGLCYNPARFNFTLELNTCPQSSLVSGSTQGMFTSAPFNAPHLNLAGKAHSSFFTTMTVSACLSVMLLNEKPFFTMLDLYRTLGV